MNFKNFEIFVNLVKVIVIFDGLIRDCSIVSGNVINIVIIWL